MERYGLCAHCLETGLGICLYKRGKQAIVNSTPSDKAATPQEAILELRVKAIAWNCSSAIREADRMIAREERNAANKLEGERQGWRPEVPRR